MAEVHPNVSAAYADLGRRQESESKSWSELTERVGEVRASALAFKYGRRQSLPTGDWLLPDGRVLHFSIAENQAIAETSDRGQSLTFGIASHNAHLALTIKVGFITGFGAAVITEDRLIGWTHNWPIQESTSPLFMRRKPETSRVVTK
jgi:hypothetical protein